MFNDFLWFSWFWQVWCIYVVAWWGQKAKMLKNHRFYNENWRSQGRHEHPRAANNWARRLDFWWMFDGCLMDFHCLLLVFVDVYGFLKFSWLFQVWCVYVRAWWGPGWAYKQQIHTFTRFLRVQGGWGEPAGWHQGGCKEAMSPWLGPPYDVYYVTSF